jgi:hypothetical protein
MDFGLLNLALFRPSNDFKINCEKIMTMNLRPNITRCKRQIMKKLCSCGAIHDLSQLLQHCGHDSIQNNMNLMQHADFADQV